MQVPSERSGVLFTVCPDDAGHAQFTVEAVWGQGEGLVSGEVTPETCIAEFGGIEARSDGDASVSDGGDALLPLRVVRRRVVPQLYKYDTLPGGGVGVCDTSPSERTAGGPLTPRLLRRLAAAGLAIAAAKGSPQDLEWCEAAGVLYIVQVRFAQSQARCERCLTWRMWLTDTIGNSIFFRARLRRLELDPCRPPFHSRRDTRG